MSTNNNQELEQEEIWSKIKDLEYTKYLISTYGNIKNTETGYILNTNNKSGYPTVLLTHQGNSITHKVHRLVAKTFLVDFDDKLVVNHKDEKKDNFKLSNLECITPSKNTIYSIKKNKFKIIKNSEKDLIEFNNLKSKRIDGFPNHSITWDGRLFSHKLNIFMNVSTNEEGYQRITLRNGTCEKKYLVHRLVALAFIPNPENKSQVNHKNSIKSDNNVDNLEWSTNRENRIHALKQYRVESIIPKEYANKEEYDKLFMKNLAKAKIECTMLKKTLDEETKSIAQMIKEIKEIKEIKA